MKCPKCHLPLPDDSEFCQFCGTKLEPAAQAQPAPAAEAPSTPPPQPKPAPEPAAPPPAPQESTTSTAEPDRAAMSHTESSVNSQTYTTTSTAADAPSALAAPAPAPAKADKAKRGKRVTQAKREKHCKYCGGVIDSGTKKCQGCGKRYSPAKRILLPVVCAVVLIALLGLNIFQYANNRSQAAALSEAEAQVRTLQDDLAQKDTQLQSLEEQLNSNAHTITSLRQSEKRYKIKSDLFHDICRACQSGKLGRASNYFYASKSIVIVPLSQKRAQFTLTADWPSASQVYTDYSGTSATYDFACEWDGSSITTYVYPYSVGVTTITFTNSLNSQTFNVVIVVVP